MGIAKCSADSSGYVVARRIGRFDSSRGGARHRRRVPRCPDCRIRSAARSAAPILIGSREQRDDLSEKAGALRDLLAGVRARHLTLTQILNDRSYTADAVQKLFAANARGGGEDFRAVGVLADYAEVEVQHEAAIEQYLRDE